MIEVSWLFQILHGADSDVVEVRLCASRMLLVVMRESVELLKRYWVAGGLLHAITTLDVVLDHLIKERFANVTGRNGRESARISDRLLRNKRRKELGKRQTQEEDTMKNSSDEPYARVTVASGR